jgi:CheY-like chemotaxis protein
VLRLALRSTLSGLGYSVRDVANISLAMSMLSSQEFDGVLIDLGRVDDAALSALERLRGASNKHCIIIVACNVNNGDDRELLEAAGADCVLGKPIDTAGIAAKLQNLIEASPGFSHSRVGFGASP